MGEEEVHTNDVTCCNGTHYQPTLMERVLRALNAFWDNQERESVDERDRGRAATSTATVRALLTPESLRHVAKETGLPTNFLQRLTGVWIPDFSMNPEEQVHVVVHHEEGTFWAEVLEWPGCFAAGQDFAELVDSLREAMYLYSESVPK